MSDRPVSELTENELRDALLACMKVRRWADEVAAAGPYADVAALLEQARASGLPLREGELEEALADHPRIGDRPEGSGRSAEFSRNEQSASASADPELERRLRDGNAAYEERFGRVFLIRAAGRSRPEILAELDRRVELAPDIERRLAEEQLLEIAELRIRASFADAAPRPAARSHVTSHVLDAVSGRPAAGVAVRLETADGAAVGAAVTDADGRVADLGPERLPVGRYRVVFDTGAYFAASGTPTFYPDVAISFELADADEHYHVPLLLSPFAYSTYRGS